MITYIATNTVNGKFYIGSTKNFLGRQKSHLSCVSHYPFHQDLQKDPESFIWDIHEDDSDGRELEQALLDMFQGVEQCYNLSPNSTGGWSHIETTGRSWINNGERERFVSLQELPGLPDGWSLGRLPFPEGYREKISKRMTDSVNNPFKRKGVESMAHERQWFCNEDRSEEIYLKPGENPPEGWIRGRKKFPPRSEESRQKTSNSLKGKQKSPEHREKLRQSTLAYHQRKRSLEDEQ